MILTVRSVRRAARGPGELPNPYPADQRRPNRSVNTDHTRPFTTKREEPVNLS